MDKVQVLMSTYNGADYIGEQIESIFTQNSKNVNFTISLLIRDDGSSDETISIIKNYSSLYPIKLITDEMSLGFKNSFFKLIDEAENADFYFFSDQDDIWKENKVESFLSFFKKDIPYLVFSDLTLFGNEEGSLYERMKIDNTKLTYKNLLLSDRVTGASSAINYIAICLIKESSAALKAKIDYHDKLIGMLIPFLGDFTYIPDQLTKYRRHGNNVTVQSVNSTTWLQRRLIALRNPNNAPTINSIIVKLSTLPEIKQSVNYQNAKINKERTDFLDRMIKFSSLNYIGQLTYSSEFLNVVTSQRSGKNIVVTKIGVFYALLRGSFLKK
ncbi:glycosyltransferase [Leuconostoc gasicomitatum]|uniref:Alpha-L-Rha alpha-1,3-L-rhamnosyltransferase n=1 Tax=Leuconostoc gasicomitatum TaxID=115778 RepID=A0ABM9V259_9LACO|nr:glycosyltransferase [Leuconostoc gasicomitatum]MBR2276382.1 glycosyltransferase [Leuconostoc sp.]MBZ5954378.1 glycosyltransferase [Leuconostoc gasicomitatum]MBZ5970019.1 glycosyltransferase [Leuconostoc gasicomitatum]MBZ5973537.1 glycosyltransferase [Leuconostoc gasicomitatum]MBZ5997628.1 glycosyltransferase [Leuconostoc gasicomitatum]